MRIALLMILALLIGCNMQPTAIAFGDSVDVGRSAPARQFLDGIVDYRHDSWSATGIKTDGDFSFKSGHPFSEFLGAAQNDGCSFTEYGRMQTELSGKFYTIITFNAGLHDMQTNYSKHGCGKVSLFDYRANLEKLSAIAEQHANIVIWINTTPVPFGYPNQIYNNQVVYNQVADGVAREHHFWILETDAEGQGVNDIHFTDLGCIEGGRKVADCILNALSDVETSTCHR